MTRFRIAELGGPGRSGTPCSGTGGGSPAAVKASSLTDGMRTAAARPRPLASRPAACRTQGDTVMQGLMQDFQLTLPHFFDRAERMFPTKQIVTVAAHRQGAVDLRRVGRAHPPPRRRARRPRHLRRRPGGDVLLEHRAPPRAVLRRPVQRPGAAHAEPAAVPRAGHLHRQPRRRRGDLRRQDGGRAAVAAAADVRARAAHRRDRRRRSVRHERPGPRQGGPRLRGLLAAAEPVEWHVEDENQAASMCYTSGTTGQPQGRRLQPPLDLAAHDGRHAHRRHRCLGDRRRAAGRPDVPRQRLGSRPRRGRRRRRPRDARSRPLAQGDRRPDRDRAGHPRRRRPHDLDGCAPRAQGPRHVVAAGHPVRRIGGPSGPVGGLPRADRAADHAGVGHDRDQPGGHRRAHQVEPRRRHRRRARRPPHDRRPRAAGRRAARAVARRRREPALGRRVAGRAAGGGAVDRPGVLQRRPLAASPSPRTAG